MKSSSSPQDWVSVLGSVAADDKEQRHPLVAAELHAGAIQCPGVQDMGATYKGTRPNDSPDLLLPIQWLTDRAGLPASLTSSASQAPKDEDPQAGLSHHPPWLACRGLNTPMFFASAFVSLRCVLSPPSPP